MTTSSSIKTPNSVSAEPGAGQAAKLKVGPEEQEALCEFIEEYYGPEAAAKARELLKPKGFRRPFREDMPKPAEVAKAFEGLREERTTEPGAVEAEENVR